MLLTLLNFCFSGCTLLFLPMQESLQKETSRLEATSSLKMWVCKKWDFVHFEIIRKLRWIQICLMSCGHTARSLSYWDPCECDTYLTVSSFHPDSDYPLPLCNIAGSSSVFKPRWIPAPAMVEQGPGSPPVCLCTIWGGKTQLHRSSYRWAGTLPRSKQGALAGLENTLI